MTEVICNELDCEHNEDGICAREKIRMINTESCYSAKGECQ